MGEREIFEKWQKQKVDTMFIRGALKVVYFALIAKFFLQYRLIVSFPCTPKYTYQGFNGGQVIRQ